MKNRSAAIVGAGPNGLASAIALAEAGLQVEALEAADSPGGGARTEELTLPGFLHDTCSAVHPMAVASPFFRSQPLQRHGLEWIFPPLSAAHPLDGGRAAWVGASVEDTASHLGIDAAAYRRLLRPVTATWPVLATRILGVRLAPGPGVAQFGLRAPWPAQAMASKWFRTEEARALLAGMAAHAAVPLHRPLTTAFALVLMASAHSAGWPVPRGGSGRITRALVDRLQELGGAVATRRRVHSLAELTGYGLKLLDITPRQLLAMAGSDLPQPYCRRLAQFRYGPGTFKMDFALDGPIPWAARECARASTVHLGGPLEEIAASELTAWSGKTSDSPFVILTQSSLFDETRAPAGKHTAWAYCHVPPGSKEDMSDRIEKQIERFAPGFRSRILARSALSPRDLERRNPNMIGGDLSGGANTPRQLIARPVASINPYATPLPGVYLCSASTPPGAGVHGMCGANAAAAALRSR